MWLKVFHKEPKGLPQLDTLSHAQLSQINLSAKSKIRDLLAFSLFSNQLYRFPKNGNQNLMKNQIHWLNHHPFCSSPINFLSYSPTNFFFFFFFSTRFMWKNLKNKEERKKHIPLPQLCNAGGQKWKLLFYH